MLFSSQARHYAGTWLLPDAIVAARDRTGGLSALGCPVLVSPMLVKAAARRASCLVPRLAPVLSSIKSPRAYSTSSGDPSEAHWCDNLLTVTGPRADIAAFADANVATSPSFLPQRTPFGGLAFLASAPGPLSFHPLPTPCAVRRCEEPGNQNRVVTCNDKFKSAAEAAERRPRQRQLR